MANNKEKKVTVTLLPTWNRSKEETPAPVTAQSEALVDLPENEHNGKALVFAVIVILVAWYLFPHTILLELFSFGTVVVGVYVSFIKK